MNEKQTAELLDGLRTAFLNRANRDGVLSRFWGMVGDRTAGQEDAANYAARLGEVLSETLLEETVAVGDGRIRFAEALAGTDPEELLRTVDGTLGQMMRHAYRMVNDAGAQAQKIADEANGLGLRSVLGNYPDERLQGLYRKIAEAAERQSGEQIQSGERKSGGTVETWLGEPVVNNCQAFYDEHVRANAEARFRMGLGPVIVRTAAPGCCAWCAKLSGVYDYDEVSNRGNDVFRRHERCRCTVTFRNGGTVQDVWSKKIWGADEETLKRRRENQYSSRAAAMGRQNDVNNWPKEGNKISENELTELKAYAADRKITLKFFDGFDGDPQLVREYIDAMDKVAKDYPKVYSTYKGGLQLALDKKMNPGDYAAAGHGSAIRINADAFRQRSALENDYRKQVELNKFVPGNASENIAYHEMGHVVQHCYRFPRVPTIEGVNTKAISIYASENASEAIAESFSSIYSGHNASEALTIKEKCDKLIMEMGNKS